MHSSNTFITRLHSLLLTLHSHSLRIKNTWNNLPEAVILTDTVDRPIFKNRLDKFWKIIGTVKLLIQAGSPIQAGGFRSLASIQAGSLIQAG